jgi:hypothetical protein
VSPEKITELKDNLLEAYQEIKAKMQEKYNEKNKEDTK